MDNDSFFSIDRLVEFGLGMGVAQQMIHVMNESVQSMYIPGTESRMQQMSAKIYYVVIEGRSVGPLNESELTQLISNNKVTKDSLAWLPGMSAWKPIETVPEILKLIALTPPPLNNK